MIRIRTLLHFLFIIQVFISHFVMMAQNQREIELERQINKVIQSFPIAGVAVSVLSADTVYYINAFGYADLETKKKYTTETIQNIASISKTVVGLSITKATELGFFKPEDPVNKYLPFQLHHPEFSQNQITIMQLATHTSGIVDRSSVYNLKCYVEAGKPVMSLKDFVFNYFNPAGKWFSEKNFSNYAPGMRYEYSNTGAALAAYIVEYATSTDFAGFTSKYIFQPLGLKNTGWFLASIDVDLHATLYDPDLKKRNLYQLITYPDGGLRTNISELTTYFRMILNNGQLNGVKILENNSITELTKPRFNPEKLPDNFPSLNQGIFWEIEKSPLAGVIQGHSGGDPGVSTMMYYLPAIKKGIIYISNTGSDGRNIEGFNQIWKILVDYAKKLE
ncbi:MAG: serine hydrolase [Bacteroidales bacterium]